MSARHYKGSWWVDFRWKRSRIRRKSPVDTKRGAEEYERQLRQELLSGVDVSRKESIEKEQEKAEAPKRNVPTLREFMKEFLDVYAVTNNKPSEVDSKRTILRCHLVPFFGSKRLDAIDVRLIEAYKAEKLKSGLAAKTINNHLTVLRKLLTVATEWTLIESVPHVKWLRTPEAEFDFLDFAEAELLLRNADDDWRAMITVAAKTGLRLGELLALRWEDVDFTNQKIMVRRSVARGIVGTPKNGKSREVPLSAETVRVLKGHRHLRGELVFASDRGRMRTKGSTKRPLWRACKQAGLRRIGWHKLRHTFASHLAMRGVPLKVIQELLGHATIEMTMRYAHLAPAVHRNAVAVLDLPAESGHQMGTMANVNVA